MEVERARCQNLISNPIILILALVIFDIENCLPTRRVEFYKKCIETFLTERENRKGAFAWSEKAKSILASSLTIPKIAHYKYKNLNANVGYRFSEDELIRSIGEAIEINDSDMIEWTEPITQYSRYLIERTELIHEVDENTLDFAHKTFYEYFLSIYFTKMTENTDLVRLLRKWIGDSNNDELARLIVEVVIQNNDPKQHDIVMNYLFDMLNRDDVQERRFRNRMDVFLLLLDLYEHNLIQPKYQKEYNKFILYNSNYIDHFGRHLKNKSYSTYGLTPYDEKSIANYFWDEVKKGNLILVVDSLKNLSEDYARNVILKDETSLMSHIHSLFSIYNYDGRRKFSKKIRRKYTDVLEIFLNEGLSYALETPQIFLAVLHLSLKIDQDDQIDKLLGYRFMSSDLFHSYMSPETTAILFNKACTSSLHCALLLISIIECMNGRTNTMFNFILMWCGRIGQKGCEFSEKVESFLIFLWMALNDSKDYETFKTMLDSYGVYNRCYDAIFEMTYNHYVEYSKGHYDDEIKTYIAQLNESH